MPPSQKISTSNNGDIRPFLTPPRSTSSQNESPLQRSWTRNRRIIASDDDETDQRSQTQALINADAVGMAVGLNDAAAAEPMPHPAASDDVSSEDRHYNGEAAATTPTHRIHESSELPVRSRTITTLLLQH
jgi:hypothetical protein